MPPAKQPKTAVSSSTPRTPAPRNKAAQTPKTAPALSPKQVFAQIQAHCLSKPGAVEDYPWGDVVWKIGGKLFAGSSQDSASVTVKASLEDQAVLVQHPAISIAKYVGRFGWVTIEIGDRDTLDLARKLIDDSFASLAPGPRTADAKRPRPTTSDAKRSRTTAADAKRPRTTAADAKRSRTTAADAKCSRTTAADAKRSRTTAAPIDPAAPVPKGR